MPLEMGEVEQMRAFQEEIARLKKVNEALMNRVEHSTDVAGSSYALFESNLLLQNKLKEHTGKLVEMNHALQREIREHKHTEKALRESEQRFRGIVENANDIIYVLAITGTFVYISPNSKNVLGYAESENLGRSFEPLIHPDDLKKCRAFLQKVIETGEKQSGIEYRIKHRDGKWRWHTTSASVLKDDTGEVCYFIGIAHDITENKTVVTQLERAYRNLREAQTQVVQSQKMAALGRLVAGVAHEFNNPVGAVQSANNTLKLAVKKLDKLIDASDPGKAESMQPAASILSIIQNCQQVVEEGMQRVSSIVKRLRTFACLDEAEIQRVDIHENLKDTISILENELKPGISIRTRFAKLPDITCYPAKLNQLFLQLIRNSNQAFERSGEITVSTRILEESVQVVVSDTGRGIPEKNLNKIFDPGFTTWGVGVGVGLGLSICYQIVQEHHGKVEVESQVGKGSTFTVSLPLDLEKRLTSMAPLPRNGA